MCFPRSCDHGRMVRLEGRTQLLNKEAEMTIKLGKLLLLHSCRPRLCKPFLLIIIISFSCIIAWRTYRYFVPSGTSKYFTIRLLGAVVTGPVLVSSDKQRVIHVEFNDAGAAHSGNHWTYLIVDDFLWGKRVIAEGYSPSSVRRSEEPFPYRWLDTRTLLVEFALSRYSYGTHMKKVVVRIP